MLLTWVSLKIEIALIFFVFKNEELSKLCLSHKENIPRNF